MKVSNLF